MKPAKSHLSVQKSPLAPLLVASAVVSKPKHNVRTRRGDDSRSFDILSPSQFLSPVNFSDFYDPGMLDLGGELAVTEMTDQELRRLGFPVPTKPPETVITEPPTYQGGNPEFPSVLESPYFQFTSRKYI
jgi:hypothetical protein